MELRDQTSEMATLRFLLQIYTNYYNFVNTEGQKNIFPFTANAVHAVKKRKNFNVFTTTTITITTECNTVNHCDKIYCVFETLTNK